MAVAKVKPTITLDLKITMKMTLQEARALEAMTSYGAKSFLEGYYKQLGKSYMQPHEKGVESLFSTIKESLPGQIRTADKIIETINEILENK